MKQNPVSARFALIALSLICSYFIFYPLSILAQQRGDEYTRKALIEAENDLVKVMNEIMQSDYLEEQADLNFRFSRMLLDALELDMAMEYPFEGLTAISGLRSKSGKCRLFTWELKDENGYNRYHGIVAFLNADKEVICQSFADSSDSPNMTEYVKTGARNWFGAIYYDIFEVTFRNEAYFVLLGLNRSKEFIKRRIVETMYFTDDSVIFGREVFRFVDRHPRRRLIYSHSKKADMTLAFYKDGIIAMDHLIPEKPQFEGKYEYYIPDLSFDALRLKKGMWEYEADFDARLDKNLKDRYYEMKLPEQEKIY